MQTVHTAQLASLPNRMNAIIRDGQAEAAKVWMLCRNLHRAARENSEKWPSRNALQKATKGKFALHSQSTQMVCHAFLANIDTTRQLRQQGDKKVRYPHKDKAFYPILWPAQAMCLKGNRVILPMGRGRSSIVLPRPEWLTIPAACKIVWNGWHNELHIVVSTEAAEQAPGDIRATIDLGQIHLAAVATDAGDALVVSGRQIRSEKRLLSKQVGEIARKRSRCQKGSRRWKKLQRARSKISLRAKRRIRDIRHKATRATIDFCVEYGVGSLYIGNPEGVRNNDSGRHHNQRMSQWEYSKDIDYLQHKAKQARIECFTGPERGTSSRCPVCGHRHKPSGRVWRCKKCGFVGHRDIVGATNMHTIAFGNVIPFPERQTYRRPAQAGRRSRPDTGQSYLSIAADQAPGSPGFLKEYAHTVVLRSEAHPL